MTDWRTTLTEARTPPTPAQRVWDGQWHWWWRRAVANGHTPNAAVPIAYTRTEDQYGKRPDSEENKP